MWFIKATFVHTQPLTMGRTKELLERENIPFTTYTFSSWEAFVAHSGWGQSKEVESNKKQDDEHRENSK